MNGTLREAVCLREVLEMYGSGLRVDRSGENERKMKKEAEDGDPYARGYGR